VRREHGGARGGARGLEVAPAEALLWRAGGAAGAGCAAARCGGGRRCGSGAARAGVGGTGG